VVLRGTDENWARAQAAAPHPVASAPAALPLARTMALDGEPSWSGPAQRMDTGPAPDMPMAAFAVGPQITQKLPPTVGVEIAAAARSELGVASGPPIAAAPMPPGDDLAAGAGRISIRGLFVAALIALVMAAAATFAVLKLKLL